MTSCVFCPPTIWRGVCDEMAWFDLSVLGPMARTVEDAALMFSAIAGPDPRAPLSLQEPGSSFAGLLAARGYRRLTATRWLMPQSSS